MYVRVYVGFGCGCTYLRADVGMRMIACACVRKTRCVYIQTRSSVYCLCGCVGGCVCVHRYKYKYARNMPRHMLQENVQCIDYACSTKK